ncbi:3-dehydroquinate dehydratase [Paenibacillus sp. GCM10012307]|uniref:3-dehydroquinate dehydratase n=1 Tax=Paenibacillus roseus TaxID=2798579 RepID=A0A934MPR3_9BACL|nr:3-dehydroquinate dehydratase [Paenibacillus roseus]MBJ6362351.1 3-dehydroquinate dehydratase [Paenibacillus roseus]
MRTMILFQNKTIPVYITESNKKTLDKLAQTLNRKWETGKNALKNCLRSLISVEIVGSEATLHAINEKDTLTISLY